jgi:NosR/NirI family transcriptional regulator, nitrous oxide reductase regulator
MQRGLPAVVMNNSIKGGKKTTQRLSLFNKRKLVPYFITLLLIIAAWLTGRSASGQDAAPIVHDLIPEAAIVEKHGSIFVGLSVDEQQIVGFAAVGEAPGYSGPISMLVAMNPEGDIIGVRIISHSETPGFFRLLAYNGFIEQFVNKHFNHQFVPGHDLDAVSGATLSAEGVAASARQAVRTIAREGLERELPPEKRALQFGIPEITLILLFAVGYVGHKLRSSVWKKRIRWGTLLTGLVVIGFIYTIPLTISQVVSLLSGYWPDFYTNLYWYLLIGGILFVVSVDAKNPYCSWFCPFGAFQECLGAVTGAKRYRPRRWKNILTWMQRGLALSAILFGLAYRNPSGLSYEPFAVLFDLRGNSFQWIFLISIVLASLLMYRPFCNIFCPIDPVMDFISESRRRIREIWEIFLQTIASR